MKRANLINQSASDYLINISALLVNTAVTDERGTAFSLDKGVEKAVAIISSVRTKEGKAMVIGNGGSAAIASHMQSDLCRSVRLRAQTFTQPPLLTTICNDCGYDSAFEHAVSMWADENDLLIAVNSSGQSENILRATKAAQDSVASAMRAELADQGIDVSSVHPVGTSTDFYEATRIRSNESKSRYNTPSALVHTPEKVAKSIVRCLRKPKPEVWPQPWSRIGLAIVTAVPAFNASSMRSLMRKRFAKARDKGAQS